MDDRLVVRCCLRRRARPYRAPSWRVAGKITRKEIPVPLLHEDDLCVALRDLNPQAPVHFLVLPIKPITQLSTSTEADDALLGHCLGVARKVARELKLDAGYRIVINDGKEGCQSVSVLEACAGGRAHVYLTLCARIDQRQTAAYMQV
jgi:histidine triad (HIT) family protein